ncbi:DUF1501 domain-containing protein [Humisphaera borealis]|uniref:DUF1501 domain-containing protein n=1 Tax=Humisphaera borealis TaxID=2807512 RepID=A0A7M2WXA1_9BACT|nr:DUF1501 domain-containing protein [Humisphaera borealis]QOV90106.1 DUF1501 domain-containing protein [Humisphaera borealis]
MSFDIDIPTEIHRRTFLRRSGLGLGAVALSGLLNPDLVRAMTAPPLPGAQSGKWPGVIRTAHFPVKAKRVIHLCMAGGPSHLESFDYKPKLAELNGKPMPESFTKGQQLAQLQNTPLIARGPFCKFDKHGKSGQEISSLFPNIAGIADEIAIVRSMVTEQINHDPAQAFMNSGSILKGRPSMGSWLLYGLGSETESLPGFVVLMSQTKGGGIQPVSARQWSAGFLPSRFQGIQFQSRGDLVHYVGNPPGVPASAQKAMVDEIRKLNGMLAEERYDPEIQTRISQYEMAFKMQTSIPELTDFANEPKHVLDQYGVKQAGDGTFASNCLLARRLAERGVRFIQLYHRGWDHHGNLERDMPISAKETDQACAALVQDLKQRGMLDDTLVIWGGEFGRTPMGQGTGRDHHILAYSMWMAGGGIKGGVTHGATDDLGYRSVDNVVHLRDLHATMLQLCGIDHTQFSVKFQGLDAKLTGVEPAKAIQPILA